MRKLIAIIIILLLFTAPARADYGPRPPAWETAAATKIARQERRRTPTPTMEPYPYPVAEDEPPALWLWVMRWIAE